MRWEQRKLPRNTDAAFTLVEVLVALALLAALSMVVWATSAAGGRSLRGAVSAVHRSAELLQIDSTVRLEAQRVVSPCWFAAPSAEHSPGELRLAYLDGSPDRCLTLSFEDGVLTVGDGVQNVAFQNVQEVRMDIASSAPGRTPALQLDVRLKGSREVRIVAALGGVPFPSAGR